MKSCGKRLQRCIICAGLHKRNKHHYEIIGCKKRKRKICVYITSNWANCIVAHIADFPYCISRNKVEINATKEKKTKEM